MIEERGEKREYIRGKRREKRGRERREERGDNKIERREETIREKRDDVQALEKSNHNDQVWLGFGDLWRENQQRQ